MSKKSFSVAVYLNIFVCEMACIRGQGYQALGLDATGLGFGTGGGCGRGRLHIVLENRFLEGAMSMLARYRRAGGFKQLLMLLESSATAKRQQLMKLIEQEDKRWALELNRRLITFPTVLSWGPDIVNKFIALIPEQTWPKALFYLGEPERADVLKSLIQYLPGPKQKHILELVQGLSPTAGEIEAAQALIIKKVRDLQGSGDFRPERIDPIFSLDGLDNILL